ncbi:Os11g0646450 [Oryza sativa Japonica Group]|uniref:Os11g0646450 protein n=1 Tax=Oryza sativa subsp. japonica TaxID=39947 RepID=A0A0N7KTA2_ORYSJ|nr:Os11g0646450 [Oryza sativa Japonica Group]
MDFAGKDSMLVPLMSNVSRSWSLLISLGSSAMSVFLKLRYLSWNTLLQMFLRCFFFSPRQPSRSSTLIHPDSVVGNKSRSFTTSSTAESCDLGSGTSGSPLLSIFFFNPSLACRRREKTCGSTVHIFTLPEGLSVLSAGRRRPRSIMASKQRSASSVAASPSLPTIRPSAAHRLTKLVLLILNPKGKMDRYWKQTL